MQVHPLMAARQGWRPARLAAATAVVLGLLAAPAQAGSVAAERIAGETRYHTAAKVALATFQRAGVALLVTGEDFPDALAASFAAGRVSGPVLLTTRDSLPVPTWQALDALAVQTVVVIGGPAVISSLVIEELQTRGYATERIAGSNRYATSAAVATHYGAIVGTLEGSPTALLASAAAFPDALAAGPIAAALHFPLLLTPAERTEDAVDAALDALEIGRILIVGGEVAVSSWVEEQYRQRGFDVERISGRNRMETARAVASMARDRLGWDMALQVLARGDTYPDALVGSIHAARSTAPILLTAAPAILSAETASWLGENCPHVAVVRALGGPAAVSDETLGDAVDAAAWCGNGDTADGDG
jgi:putative cell wall-binding protein